MTRAPVAVPDGHYAVPDPADPTQVTYWRATSKGQQHSLTPWPRGAHYGPELQPGDIPADLTGDDRRDWVTRWTETHHDPWHTAIRAAITSDPRSAGKRFAELTMRCCNCARALTDPFSTVLGLGPDCRTGIDPATLADYLAQHTSHAHPGVPYDAPEETT